MPDAGLHSCEPTLDCPVRSGDRCDVCRKAKCTHVMCAEGVPSGR